MFENARPNPKSGKRPRALTFPSRGSVRIAHATCTPILHSQDQFSPVKFSMPFNAHDSLICPIDGSPLLFENASLSCTHGHRYDIGKPGYANLLSAQHKRSKAPGDSKEMVNARTAFLSEGFYDPIASELAELVGAQTQNDLTLVDAGCGEGYYLEKIDSLTEARLNLIGFDISKWAVQKPQSAVRERGSLRVTNAFQSRTTPLMLCWICLASPTSTRSREFSSQTASLSASHRVISI